MKRFLLSVVALVTLAGFALATDGYDSVRTEPAPTSEVVTPEVTEPEVLKKATVIAALDATIKHADFLALPICTELGPKVDATMFDVLASVASLNQYGVDVTKLEKLAENASVQYGIARETFREAKLHIQLGDILAVRAKRAEGEEVYIFYTEATVSYCKAASCLEQCQAALERSLKIFEDAQALAEKLHRLDLPVDLPTNAIDKIAGLYHS